MSGADVARARATGEANGIVFGEHGAVDLSAAIPRMTEQQIDEAMDCMKYRVQIHPDCNEMSAYFLSNGDMNKEMKTQVDTLNHACIFEVLTGGWRSRGGTGDDRVFAQWAKQYGGRTQLKSDTSFHHGREGIERQARLEALVKERMEAHPDRAGMQACMEGLSEEFGQQCRSLQKVCVREVYQGDGSGYGTWLKEFPGNRSGYATSQPDRSGYATSVVWRVFTGLGFVALAWAVQAKLRSLEQFAAILDLVSYTR